jgi:carbon monoxide dehydrogenase subunit G
MKVERRIDIAAPPERIYDLLMDPRRLADWVSIHAGLKDAPDGDLREGSELTQCLKLAGRRINVDWTVVEAERPARVVWEGRGPVHSRARVIYDLTRDGEGTSFSYLNEYKLPGGPIGRLGGRAFQRISDREADRSLEQLKRLSEG